MEYSKILGVDPSELVFDDLQTHIWGKVDLLNSNELEDLYDPGRIFTYYTKMNDAQVVTVPRNIWRSDIMAIKVTSPGSMYHNQVAFYYKSKDWSKAIPNRLCVMAVRVQMEELGIDEKSVLSGIKDIADTSIKEETRLKALFKLGDIMDLEDKNQTKVTQISGAIFKGFSEESIEAAERPQIEE